MSERRRPIEIKKKIIKLLKGGEMSLRQLESKVNTSNQTIKNHLEELEYFGKIIFIKHLKNPKNGRPYTTVKLLKKN